MRDSINNKFRAPKYIFIVFLIFFVILYGRFTFLALSPVIDNIEMKDFAKERNTEDKKLYATRGTIYDKNGNILSTNVAAYTVIAYLDSNRTVDSKYPMHVVDKKKTAEFLAPIINMDEEIILSLLEKDLYQVELGPGGRNISELKKDEIVALNLPGIDFIATQKRNYSNGDFASYVIGYAKRHEKTISENGLNKVVYDMVGELGIELKYNDLLKGTDGRLIRQKDRFGYTIPDTKEQRIDAINGSNIYLTLDSAIQRFLESAVKDASKNYNPEWFQLTVMDAKTGAILGTSSTPSFNPNILNIINYENPLTSYLYEPGSTMKTFTYMCAIEKGTYRGDEHYNSGSIVIDGYTIRDWNGYGWGQVTFDQGYEFSSNVAIANVVNRFINKNDLRECFKKYGFGEKTEIELPRELKGDLNFSYDIEVATAGFGQGITTTAIQHLQALTIIANDGTMLKPYIVDKIVDSNTNEVTYQSKIEKNDNIVSSTTVSKMKELMYKVVNGNDVGTTGLDYKITGFDIMGKTGTAQIYDNNTGTYLTGYNDYIYSFSGIFPKDEPEIIIYGAMKKPSHNKSLALSIATKDVMRNIAKYLNIFETESEINKVHSYKLSSYITKDLENVVKELENLGIEPIVLGSGDKIINQFPKKNNTVITGDKVFLLTNDNNIKMPNIINFSKIDVINLTNLLNLKSEITGYGYVINQSIEKGTLLKEDDVLSVELKSSKKEVDEKEEIS